MVDVQQTGELESVEVVNQFREGGRGQVTFNPSRFFVRLVIILCFAVE